MKDKIIENLIQAEIKRQNETLDLIPSENFASKDVLTALGSVFNNKYAEGYAGARYYGGNEVIDKLEILAKERSLRAFDLRGEEWAVNVQPYSGSPANLAIYVALVPLGEKIMGLQLDMGGHLTHGHKVSFTSKAWKAVQYGLNRETEQVDYDEVRRLAVVERPKIIVAGATAYPRIFDFKKFREICDEVGAYFMVDMSHFAGLVAGGAHPSPFSAEGGQELADIVMTTCHKTLRGPRAGVIFTNRKSKTAEVLGVDIAKAVDKAIFPGLQGGPHENQVAAIAVAMEEAAQPEFKEYAKQVVKNAKILASEMDAYGFRVISGGTDTHLMLIDVVSKGISGSEASDKLEENRIIVNKNTIPFDARKPMDPSGIRMGPPALTTRGMKEGEMKEVAKLIADVLLEKKEVRDRVKKLCARFPLDY
ncbi:MAG: serine hydroxymethyltransferase [bacterium]|nr:serine hydroxymethyltransferase [bacterium]